MRITELLHPGSPAFSFEFFPPKSVKGEESLFQTISEMKALNPAFVSVTCGAGGSEKGKTVEWAERILRDHGIEAVVHLTCLGQTTDSLEAVVDEICDKGLRNILALRGDRPKNGNFPPDIGCQYASELVSLIRDRHPEACILGACYPETHTESTTSQADLDHLKAKVDAGTDVLITQLFFDTDVFLRFVDSCRTAGITIPILPGIMPVTNVDQLERFTQMCGATIPDRLLNSLDTARTDPQDVIAIGVDHAIEQCLELIEAGAPGIHFYTLNRSPATRLVVRALRRELAHTPS